MTSRRLPLFNQAQAALAPITFQIDAGPFGYVDVSVAPSTTFAELKYIIEWQLGMPRSWQRFSALFHDSLTLLEARAECHFDTLVVLSDYKPLRLSDSGREPFLPVDINTASDCVRDVKQRTDYLDSADCCILFNGRNLPDDFALADLPGTTVRDSRFSILRLVARATESIPIRIQASDGRSISLAVKASDGITDVKDQIEEKEAIPVHDQCLFFGYGQLESCDTVGDYGIQNYMTLQLVVPGDEMRAATPQGSASIEIMLNNLEDGTVSSVLVGGADPISAAAPSLKWGTQFEVGICAWLRGVKLDPRRTFQDYSIRSGTVLHLEIGLEIIVKLMDGKCITLCVRPETRASDVKALIEASEGIPVEVQRLVYAGMELAHENSLQDYGFRGMTPGSITLCMSLVLRG